MLPPKMPIQFQPIFDAKIHRRLLDHTMPPPVCSINSGNGVKSISFLGWTNIGIEYIAVIIWWIDHSMSG